MISSRVATGFILLAAVLARLPGLFGRSWWLDELLTWKVAQLPLWRDGALDVPRSLSHSILGFSLHDTGPGPLMYLLEGVFSRWAAPMGGEFWLRIPGIAAGLATIGIMLLRGRIWTGSRSGALLIAALAATFAGYAEFSTGARGYAWLVLAAVLQWDLTFRLLLRRETNPLLAWAAFSGLACAAVLLHSVHVLWTGSLLGGILVARYFRRGSAASKLSRGWLAAGLLVMLIVHVSWIGLWQHALSASFVPAFTQGNPLAKIWHTLLDYRGQEAPILLALVGVISGTAAMWKWSGMPRAILLAIFSAVVCCGLLNALLLLWFAPGARYFYALTVPLLWMLGCLAVAIVRSAGKYSAAAGEWVKLGLLLLILVAPLKSAIWHSGAAEHNWRGAMDFLKSRVQPDDLLLCGPNADLDVMIEYVRAAKLPAQPPRWLTNEFGQRFDCLTLAGLQQALRSGRRVWFVTPHWGIVRPPEYWQLIRDRFQQAALIPGKIPMQVWLLEG
ncbi:MAG: hypothetical protein ACR2IE_20490 [Candidatus Sumerlaeaceae bacterium]